MNAQMAMNRAERSTWVVASRMAHPISETMRMSQGLDMVCIGVQGIWVCDCRHCSPAGGRRRKRAITSGQRWSCRI